MDIDRRGEQGRTLLLVVLWKGRADTKKLIATGTRIEIGDDEGHHSFHLAVWKQAGELFSSARTQAMELLLHAGAAVNTATTADGGATPLHYAAGNGMTEAVQTLLCAGAAANATDNQGATPLHGAADRGRMEAAESLICADAAVNTAGNQASTSVHLAAFESMIEAVESFVRGLRELSLPGLGGVGLPRQNNSQPQKM